MSAVSVAAAVISFAGISVGNDNREFRCGEDGKGGGRTDAQDTRGAEQGIDEHRHKGRVEPDADRKAGNRRVGHRLGQDDGGGRQAGDDVEPKARGTTSRGRDGRRLLAVSQLPWNCAPGSRLPVFNACASEHGRSRGLASTGSVADRTTVAALSTRLQVLALSDAKHVVGAVDCLGTLRHMLEPGKLPVPCRQAAQISDLRPVIVTEVLP